MQDLDFVELFLFKKDKDADLRSKGTDVVSDKMDVRAAREVKNGGKGSKVPILIAAEIQL